MSVRKPEPTSFSLVDYLQLKQPTTPLASSAPPPPPALLATTTPVGQKSAPLMFTFGDFKGTASGNSSQQKFAPTNNQFNTTAPKCNIAPKNDQVDILLAQNEMMRRRLHASDECLNHTKASFEAEKKSLNGRIAQVSAEVKLCRSSEASLKSQLDSAMASVRSASVSARLDRVAMEDSAAEARDRLLKSNTECDELRLTLSGFVKETEELHAEVATTRKAVLSIEHEKRNLDAIIRDHKCKLDTEEASRRVTEGLLRDAENALDCAKTELKGEQNHNADSNAETGASASAFEARVEVTKTEYETARKNAEALSHSLDMQLKLLEEQLPERSRPLLEQYATKLAHYQRSTGRARALARVEVSNLYHAIIAAPVDKVYHEVIGCDQVRPPKLVLTEHATLPKTHLFAKDDFVMRIGTELVSKHALDTGDTMDVRSLGGGNTPECSPGHGLNTAEARMTAAVSAITADLARALRSAQVAHHNAFGEGGEQGEGRE